MSAEDTKKEEKTDEKKIDSTEKVDETDKTKVVETEKTNADANDNDTKEDTIELVADTTLTYNYIAGFNGIFMLKNNTLK